jgi:hypothetical protein
MRIDLVFSYWVYFWYILYYYRITTFSPKFPLLLGLFDNVVMLVLMMYYGTSNKTIVYFIVINTIIKVIPLYYLRDERLKIRDIYFTCILFIIFISWLYVNGESLTGNAKLIYSSLLYEKNQTPFFILLEKIERNFKKYKLF